MDRNLLYKWIAILTCTFFGFFVIHMFQLWNGLWQADQTKLSFVILLVWFISSISVLYKIFKPYNINEELLWFTSESMITLGLIGTVSGFLLMLYCIWRNWCQWYKFINGIFESNGNRYEYGTYNDLSRIN